MKSQKILRGGGSDICLIARNEKDLKVAKEEILKISQNEVLAFAGDISDEAFVKFLFNQLKQNGYEIETLINNAGVGRFCKAIENSKKIIDEVLCASVIGTILITSAALPLMSENGTIATIMSTAAVKGNANETAYCAAKWGERGFMEALRKEYESSSLKFICVFPGGINTSFWNDNRHYVSIEKAEKFMNPKELASTICEAIKNKESLFVKDMIIEKL